MSSSRMRAFIAAGEWKTSLRIRATTHRRAICTPTPTSTFALSRGRRGRAGRTVVP
jgi:hypothetical protein